MSRGVNKIVLFIFLLVIVANVVLFYESNNSLNKNNVNSIVKTYPPQPTPTVSIDKNTNLATYRSIEGNFLVSYPADFSAHADEVVIQNTNQYHPVKNVFELDSTKLHKAPYILIQFSPNFTKEDVSDYVENSTECDEIENATGERVTIGGVPGLIYKNVTCSSLGETRIYFLHGTMSYNIIFSGKPVDETLLSQIINSFAFLKS